VSTAAALYGVAPAREATASAGHDLFAPDVPLVWWYGRLRYADEKAAPVQLRLRERFRRWWYDRLKSPPVGTEGKPVFPDYRGFYATRAEARSHCPVGDPMAFVAGFPFGGEPFGDEVFDIPTFCRPYHDGEQDRRDATRYAKANLRSHICAEVQAENERQRAELEKFWALVPGAARLSRRCDEV
jgi:hypothetical protein